MQVTAQAGINVTMVDMSDDVLKKSMVSRLIEYVDKLSDLEKNLLTKNHSEDKLRLFLSRIASAKVLAVL